MALELEIATYISNFMVCNPELKIVPVMIDYSNPKHYLIYFLFEELHESTRDELILESFNRWLIEKRISSAVTVLCSSWKTANENACQYIARHNCNNNIVIIQARWGKVFEIRGSGEERMLATFQT